MYVGSKHTTLFRRCNNLVDVQTTLFQRQNNVVCLLVRQWRVTDFRFFHFNSLWVVWRGLLQIEPIHLQKDDRQDLWEIQGRRCLWSTCPIHHQERPGEFTMIILCFLKWLLHLIYPFLSWWYYEILIYDVAVSLIFIICIKCWSFYGLKPQKGSYNPCSLCVTLFLKACYATFMCLFDKWSFFVTRDMIGYNNIT